MTRSEAAAWLLAHDHFCILTHRNPDGDTIGCAVGLCRGLRSLGKTAHILRNPQFGPRYAQWYDGLLCEEPAADDTIVSVDIASEALLPDNARPLAGHIQLALDHHGSNTGFAHCDCVEGELAACGELIYGILRELRVDLTADIASALYLAVSTDTGCFQYANTTANTLRVAAELIDAGCEAYPINKEFFGTRSISRLRLESRLTDSLEFFADGKVAICHIPLSWMEELGLREEELDSISGFSRSLLRHHRFQFLLVFCRNIHPVQTFRRPLAVLHNSIFTQSLHSDLVVQTGYSSNFLLRIESLTGKPIVQ